MPTSTTTVAASMPTLAAIARLSDSALLAQLFDLVKRDRELTVALLLHLGEVELRRLHCAGGCSSLFSYCVQRLGFSEGVAFKRVGAARLGRRFPLTLELLARGELHLSALMLVGPHLTEENHRDWLTAACKKTRREVERLVATRCPKPDVAPSVRKLPERSTAFGDGSQSPDKPGALAATKADDTGVDDNGASLSTAGACAPEAEVSPRRTPTAIGAMSGIGAHCRQDHPARVEPLSGSSYRVVFTAGEALKHKLDRARELVSHSVAPGNLSALIERAIDLLISNEEKRRFAVRTPREGSVEVTQPTQPTGVAQRDPDLAGSGRNLLEDAANEPVAVMPTRRGSNPQSSAKGKRCRRLGLAAEFSRYVPASVRRAVWERDAGQCSFIDDAGNRCTAREFLQIEHDTPHARGGPSTVGNVCLRCRSHNSYAANLAFGKKFMQRAIARARVKDGEKTKRTAPPRNS